MNLLVAYFCLVFCGSSAFAAMVTIDEFFLVDDFKRGTQMRIDQTLNDFSSLPISIEIWGNSELLVSAVQIAERESSMVYVTAVNQTFDARGRPELSLVPMLFRMTDSKATLFAGEFVVLQQDITAYDDMQITVKSNISDLRYRIEPLEETQFDETLDLLNLVNTTLDFEDVDANETNLFNVTEFFGNFTDERSNFTHLLEISAMNYTSLDSQIDGNFTDERSNFTHLLESSAMNYTSLSSGNFFETAAFSHRYQESAAMSYSAIEEPKYYKRESLYDRVRLQKVKEAMNMDNYAARERLLKDGELKNVSMGGFNYSVLVRVSPAEEDNYEMVYFPLFVIDCVLATIAIMAHIWMGVIKERWKAARRQGYHTRLQREELDAIVPAEVQEYARRADVKQRATFKNGRLIDRSSSCSR